MEMESLDMSELADSPIVKRVLRLRERMSTNDVAEISTSVDNQCTQGPMNTSFVEDKLDVAPEVESLDQYHKYSWRDWTQWDQWSQWSRY